MRLLRLRLRALSGDTTGHDLAMAGRDVGNDMLTGVGLLGCARIKGRREVASADADDFGGTANGARQRSISSERA